MPTPRARLRAALGVAQPATVQDSASTSPDPGLAAPYAEAVLEVPPRAFEPPPRVDSAVVRMVPRPPEAVAAIDATRLGALVAAAFSQRRKLLRHSLGPWIERHAPGAAFDLQRRAEEVPVAEYVALALHRA